MLRTINIIFIALLLPFIYSCATHEGIDSLLTEKFTEGKLNGNVLIMKNGKTILEKSYGFADGSKSVPLNKDFRFIIGSVYKEFPAVSTMKLVEKGSIKLDDKINLYLQDLPVWSEKISIKNLLQYSSGLPQIGWNNYFSNGITITDELIAKEIQDIEKLQFEPGTDYLYTNFSPILLIRIIEKVTESQFKDYIQENIFNPNGLKNTIIMDQYPFLDKTLMAIPFDENYEEDNYNISLHNLNFSATASDLHKWLEQLGNFKIISKQSVKTLSEKAMKGQNIQAPLGRADWSDDQIIEHSHHGSSGNYECVVRRFKQEDITIVILTNQKHENVYDISEKIFEILTNK